MLRRKKCTKIVSFDPCSPHLTCLYIYLITDYVRLMRLDLVSDYNNAPVGLQLISKRNHDEELLDAMKLIQGIV